MSIDMIENVVNLVIRENSNLRVEVDELKRKVQVLEDEVRGREQGGMEKEGRSCRSDSDNDSDNDSDRDSDRDSDSDRARPNELLLPPSPSPAGQGPQAPGHEQKPKDQTRMGYLSVRDNNNGRHTTARCGRGEGGRAGAWGMGDFRTRLYLI